MEGNHLEAVSLRPPTGIKSKSIAKQNSGLKENKWITGFSSKDICELTGVSYRRLDYYARINVLIPSIAQGHGSGSVRRYSLQDLLIAKLLRTLFDYSIDRDVIVIISEHIRHLLLTNPKLVCWLVIEDEGMTVCRTRDELADHFMKTKSAFVVYFDANEVVEQQTILSQAS